MKKFTKNAAAAIATVANARAEAVLASGKPSKIPATLPRFAARIADEWKICAEIGADLDRVVSAVEKSNIYAVEKIAKILEALNAGNAELLDVHTRQICMNAAPAASMQNTKARAAVSSECGGEGISVITGDRVRRTYRASTASTQTSSTRSALDALGLLSEYRSRSREFTFADSKGAHMLFALFSEE